MPKAERAPSFEDLYSRLEEHVTKLEQGGLTLDEAIELFEQGMALARQCQERLEAADLKITRLKESFAALERQPNGADADDDDEATEYERIREEDALDPEDEVFP